MSDEPKTWRIGELAEAASSTEHRRSCPEATSRSAAACGECGPNGAMRSTRAQKSRGPILSTTLIGLGPPPQGTSDERSASGLDPDISPANAVLQVARVARARGVTPAEINALIKGRITGRSLGILGEPRVNVLDLNLALQRAYPRAD